MSLEIDTLNVGPLEVNCYIIGCNDHKVCAVFDPGDSSKRIFDAIQSKGWELKLIINTHGHADHTGANAKLKALTQAPLGIHKNDSPLLSHPEMKDMAEYLGGSASPEADDLYSDGDIITICPCLEFKLLHTPGHTPGGSCFVFDNAVVTGDTLFNTSIGRTDLPGGNHQELLNSIRTKLFTLPGSMIVYPGHGETSTIEHEKTYNPFIGSNKI